MWNSWSSSILTHYWSDFNMLQREKRPDTLKQTVWKRPVKIRVDCKTVRIFAYSSTLYARTVKQKLKTESETGFFFPLASPALRIRACEAHALALTLLLRNYKPVLGKKPAVLQSKIRATLAITELYATNEIMIKKHVLFLTWLVRDDNYLSW